MLTTNIGYFLSRIFIEAIKFTHDIFKLFG